MNTEPSVCVYYYYLVIKMIFISSFFILFLLSPTTSHVSQVISPADKTNCITHFTSITFLVQEYMGKG